MSAFRPVDAALEGFRFTREHPRALLPWTALVFGAGLAGSVLLVVSGAQPAMVELKRLAAQPSPDSAAVMALAPRLIPALMVQALLGLPLFAVLSCSAFRALLGQDAAPRLRLGRMELWMIGLALVLGGLGLLVSTLVGGVLVGLGRLVGLSAPAAGAAITALGELASLALQALLMVRLALAAPMLVQTGGWRLAESWARTRGRFWPLLASLVVSFLLYVLVVVLAHVIFSGVMGLVLSAGGGSLAGVPAAITPADSGLAAVFQPGVLAYQLLSAVLFALGLPIFAGPLAAAHRTFPAAGAAGHSAVNLRKK